MLWELRLLDYCFKMAHSDRQMKIAILGTRGYPSFYGGFETAVRHIVDESSKEKFRFYVFSRKVNCLPDPQKENVKVIYTPFLNQKSLSTLSHIFASTRKLLNVKPDVVLAFNVACGFVLPLTKLAGIRSVLNVDGLEWKRGKWGILGKLAFFTGAKLSAAFADELIADSVHIAEYWKVNFGRSPVFIPYGGTEPINEVNSLRPKEGFLLYVARFVPENHFKEFLDSLTYLDQSIPVVIVGSSNGKSPMNDQLDALKKSRGNITALGNVKNEEFLNNLWAYAGVYFHGHSVGGTNPALVQAMASGCPIVAYDSIFNREVLGDAGLFTDALPSLMAKKFEEVLLNRKLQAELAQKAQLRARQYYAWSNVVNNYEKLMISEYSQKRKQAGS